MSVKVVSFVLGMFICCAIAGEWSYDGETDGAEHWKDHYPACGGSSQSPINIVPWSASYKSIASPILDRYDVDPAAGALELTNNGHTVQVNIKSGSFVLRGAGLTNSYQLAQFHLHWGGDDCAGSEHTVNGLHYPLEIHLVHYNTKYPNISEALNYADGLAVLGIMADVGDVAHPTFSKITDGLKAVQYAGQTTTIQSFKLNSLLPSNLKDFVRYSGSLTTPGCLEIVTWTVLKDSIKISQAQMNALRGINHNVQGEVPEEFIFENFRPTQPLNSRVVYKTYGSSGAPTDKPCFKA